ncbi:AAA family ATPase [Haloarchaeobius litoreus]|uniref:AAA family ATPase n=1 Tax=Haloarchaeobius litoreus TaxID=755306 RepID=A0ABD6DKP2_9EURY|nr:AAA family ATPase [Haloarchaeobius litoreus]
MELIEIKLENFRQFRDESITFARGNESNITVVHGSNGSGKTTLLNAFTWLFYDKVDFDTRPERLASEGAMADAEVGESVTVSVRLRFEHEGTEYDACRTAVYKKQSSGDFDGEVDDMDLDVKLKRGDQWQPRGNPENTLDQVIPERLSGLFFFDGEDIDELAGIDNQDRIQEAIENIMGLTILERATRHLDTVAGRFESEVSENASEELSALIEEKQTVEEEVEELKRSREDTQRAKSRVEQEIQDLEQRLEAFDDSARLQQQRKQYQETIDDLEEDVEQLNAEIREEISNHGFVPLAMPLIRDTAEELDAMREEGVIPSELSNSFIDSLLEAEQCICGRALERGTEHYKQVQAMQGDTVADGVEQSALRTIGNLNHVSEIENSFFDKIDERIEERKELHDDIDGWVEKVDDISSELQDSEVTTESGLSIGDLEVELQAKKDERDELISEIGRIDEKTEQRNERVNSLEREIDEQEDERAEARVAKQRQKAAEEVRDQLDGSFTDLKDKVRKWANQNIQETFSEIASKDLIAEVTEEFELKISQEVGEERVEVDKSTGERQIASLAFIGSLVDIARNRYESESESEYFQGGIYPIVMDSPFGALDKDHRREVSRVIPTLANQVIVFATDSQWEGPVQEEMEPIIGQQYWLDFDPGKQDGKYPQTKIQTDAPVLRGD